METVLVMIALFLAAFLLGSIPFGLIISRVFYHTDIRQHGSGNIGTTNAIRTIGRVGGYAVFVLDFAKGLASGLLAWIAWEFFLSGVDLPSLITHNTIIAIAFLGCILGHIFNPWLKFKGGKGIAVAVGCLFMLFGIPWTLVELALFVILVLITRYVSVGSIAAAIACPIICIYVFWGDPIAWILSTLGALTVVWAHRENITRLAHGTENKIGSKKKEPSSEDEEQ